MKEQSEKTGDRFLDSGNQCVVRLITPLRMKYEDSYARAFQFVQMVGGMLNPKTIEDTVQPAKEAIGQEKRVTIIINNRSKGNSPLIAQSIASRVLAAQCLISP